MPFFSALQAVEIDAFARIASKRRVDEGAAVVRQGEEDCHLYLVAEGRLQVSTSTHDGGEILLNVLGPGTHFGELALFDCRARSATVTAMEPSTLFVFGRDDVLGVLHRFPAIAIRFLEAMALRVRQLTERAEELTELPTQVRIARKLLQIGEEQGEWITSNHVVLPSFVTQQNLARHVQTRRETVNRCLRAFGKQDLLQLATDRLVILDCAGLRKVGGMPARSSWLPAAH